MHNTFKNHKYILFNIIRENEAIILKTNKNEYYIDYNFEDSILHLKIPKEYINDDIHYVMINSFRLKYALTLSESELDKFKELVLQSGDILEYQLNLKDYDSDSKYFDEDEVYNIFNRLLKEAVDRGSQDYQDDDEETCEDDIYYNFEIKEYILRKIDSRKYKDESKKTILTDDYKKIIDIYPLKLPIGIKYYKYLLTNNFNKDYTFKELIEFINSKINGKTSIFYLDYEFDKYNRIIPYRDEDKTLINLIKSNSEPNSEIEISEIIKILNSSVQQELKKIFNSKKI